MEKKGTNHLHLKFNYWPLVMNPFLQKCMQCMNLNIFLNNLRDFYKNQRQSKFYFSCFYSTKNPYFIAYGNLNKLI